MFLKDNHTLKVILVIKTSLIKVIEFYLNLEGCPSNNSQSRLLTVAGEDYELIVGNKEVMYGFSGVGIRKKIERIPQRYVALISSHERIRVTGKALEEFLLPIGCEEEIIEKVESSIDLFARGKL